MAATNILFILVDQWPVGAFSFRGGGLLTPNIDRLATAGTVFTNTHSYEKMKAHYEEQGQSLVRGRAPFWGETRLAKERQQPFPIMANGIDFLEKWAAGGREKPFFLTVSSAPPHFPHHLPADYAKIADNLRRTVKLPTSLDDNGADRPWFHSVPWWPCMDTAALGREEWRTVIAYSQAHIMLVDEAIGGVLDVGEDSVQSDRCGGGLRASSFGS